MVPGLGVAPVIQRGATSDDRGEPRLTAFPSFDGINSGRCLHLSGGLAEEAGCHLVPRKVPSLGLEPRLMASKATVLPLDELGTLRTIKIRRSRNTTKLYPVNQFFSTFVPVFAALINALNNG